MLEATNFYMFFLTIYRLTSSTKQTSTTDSTTDFKNPVDKFL